jgi:hypothetical protein
VRVHVPCPPLVASYDTNIALTLPKTELDTLLPNTPIVAIETTIIRASMTAYSVAVGPASSRQNARTIAWNRFRVTDATPFQHRRYRVSIRNAFRNAQIRLENIALGPRPSENSAARGPPAPVRSRIGADRSLLAPHRAIPALAAEGGLPSIFDLTLAVPRAAGPETAVR